MVIERVRMRDLAERFRVSRATLYRWVDQGMPSEKIGGVRLFDPEKVEAWIANRAREEDRDDILNRRRAR